MNNEQQELLGDAYKNYLRNCLDRKWMKEIFHSDGSSNHHLFLQEEFINKCKTDTEFSERWGLKIEERELSTVERMEYYGKHYMKEGEAKSFDDLLKVDYVGLNIPTKLITITYNNETTKSYE